MPKVLCLEKVKISVTMFLCLALLVFLHLSGISLTLRVYTRNSERIDREQKRWEETWVSPGTTRFINCDRTHFEYDLCYLNRPTILEPTAGTFFATDPTNTFPQQTEKIRPYPRNFLHTGLDQVMELTLTTAPQNASCAATHDSPALVFSAGGWKGNVFHDFNENFIPLFITVDTFFPDRDFILGIYNCSDWWLHHYRNLLSSYTIHPIINLDKETTLHCFSSAIVGLVSHGPTIVDPTVQRGPHPKTLHDFRAFLIANYVQSHATLLGKIMGDSALSLPWRSRHRPRLLIVNRGGTRRILNIDDVYRVAEEMGFEVVVFEPSPTTSLHEAFRVVHSSHALIGVHGDALTNILFLRPGAVFMQMVPLKCGWLGNICFGKMAIRLGLEYIIYEIRGHESAIELDNVTRDWLATREDPMEQWAIYKRQLITLDLARLKKYLERICKTAKKLMHKQIWNNER